MDADIGKTSRSDRLLGAISVSAVYFGTGSLYEPVGFSFVDSYLFHSAYDDFFSDLYGWYAILSWAVLLLGGLLFLVTAFDVDDGNDQDGFKAVIYFYILVAVVKTIVDSAAVSFFDKHELSFSLLSLSMIVAGSVMLYRYAQKSLTLR